MSYKWCDFVYLTCIKGKLEIKLGMLGAGGIIMPVIKRKHLCLSNRNIVIAVAH